MVLLTFYAFSKDIAGCCEIQMFSLFCQNLRWVHSNETEYTYILQISNRQRTFAVCIIYMIIYMIYSYKREGSGTKFKNRGLIPDFQQ